MTDTPQSVDAQVDVEAIHRRLNSFYGFYHEYRDVGWMGENVLAELDAEGKWRTWDQRAPYSKEACEFIAAAPADIRALLRERDARERRLRELESVYDQHYPTPVCTAVPHEEQRSYGLGYSHGVAEVLKALYPILHPEAKETRP